MRNIWSNFILDESPSYNFLLLSNCSPPACSQLSFNILFCYPLYNSRLQRSRVFQMRNAARLPIGCPVFGLSVNQHITIASDCQHIVIFFFFVYFCFGQAAGLCCNVVLLCLLSIFVMCLMKCVESDLPWPVHKMLKKMLILSYLAAAFRNATVSLRGLTSTLARCQNYQPLPCKCTQSCDITVFVWRMLPISEWILAEG